MTVTREALVDRVLGDRALGDRALGDRDRLGVLDRTDAVAVVLGDRTISYAELDGLIEQRGEELGATRRLVLLECANALQPLVTYLAALRRGHPVLLMPRAQSAAAREQWLRAVADYRPDLICSRRGTGWVDEEVRTGTSHDLHPDLAVLLGTSGSTGTPKLVRLSRENLSSNAAAIGRYLDLGPSSRAATTLPMQYCYGLSVVNSHLQAGGSLWLTESSVVDPGFWDDFAAAGATSFAGVPYTFDLLARSGVDWLAQPGLRQVTQAGGRLAPERVRDLALRSQARGVDFFVMYGQTEATARMAYLPPDLAARRPECIGIPIDGGDLRIEEGELIYTGPNVMLGYAETATDLALGETLTELRTGDLAVQHDDGLFEIVGRSNRIAKLYGTRLDLDLTRRMLGEHGLDAELAVVDQRLDVFVRESGADRARELVAAAHCVPLHAIRCREVEDFPRHPNGKVDLAGLAAMAENDPAPEQPGDVRAAYTAVFGREVGHDDSFVSLHGDSLSYVETYTRLERLLGAVPQDWPQLTVAELSHRVRRPRRFWAALETPIALRAAAIVLLVGCHVDLWPTQGGAHVLLAIFGYNIARFALASPVPRERVVAVLRGLGDMLAPALLLALVVIAFDGYRWPTLFLLNHVLGNQESWDANWQFWFLESTTWTAVALVGLLSLPGIRAAYARWPFGVVVAVLGAAMLVRATTVPGSGVMHLYTPQATAWCLLLGVVVAHARTRGEKVAAVLLAPACTLGFFPVPSRGYLVIGAVVMLLLVPWLPVPRLADRLVATISSASLYIYLAHWRFYEQIEASGHRVLALLASLAVGVLAWAACAAVRRRLVVEFGGRAPLPAPDGVPRR